MRNGEVGARWRAALERARVPLDPAVAEGWLDLIEAGPPGRSELEGLIALHARQVGEQGGPASRPVLQVYLLLDALGRRADPAWLAIAADAHAVGAATRLERRRRLALRHLLPVVALPSGEVWAAAVGPLDGELLDALLGRAFVLAVGTRAHRVILDLAGVEELDEDLVLATASGYPTHDLADRVQLVLSGLSHPEQLQARLEARGDPRGRVFCVSRLRDLHEP